MSLNLLNLFRELVAGEDRWERLGIVDVFADGASSGRAPGAGIISITASGTRVSAVVSVWLKEEINGLELVTGEDASWERLGIVNIFAAAGNSGRLAPGASIISIAGVGIRVGASSVWLKEEIHGLELVTGEDASWERLGIVNIFAAAGNSGRLAPGASIISIAGVGIRVGASSIWLHEKI